MYMTHTHPFNDPFLGLPRWAGTRKVKTIWILLKQETVSGSGISWAICKSAPRSRQITTPAPHHSVFYRPDALPAAQPTVSKHWRPIHVYDNEVQKDIEDAQHTEFPATLYAASCWQKDISTFVFCYTYISSQWPSVLWPSVLWHCWLGGRKGIRPVKNWVVGCWHGYMSGAICRLAYGPADATATHCLLLQ